MEINKCDETEAEKELKRIAGDNQITGQDVDWTDMGDKKAEEEEVDESDQEEGDVDESSEEPTGSGDDR